MTIGSLKKTILLLTLTTLTITLGTSVTWNSPQDGAELKDPITMNVTLESGSQVNFTVEGPNNENYTKSGSKGDYITQSFSAGSGNGGSYTLTAEDGQDSDSINVKIDEVGPSISLENNREYVGSNPSITLTLDDPVTGVREVNITASDSDVIDTTENCEGNNNCEIDVTLDTGNVNAGEQINLDITATDDVGNTNSKSFSFTLDDSYDGDDSAEVKWAESGSKTLSGSSGEDQEVTVSLDSGDSVSDTTVVCLVDDNEVDSSTNDIGDDGGKFSCEFDSGTFSGTSFKLTVKAKDAAGHTQTVVDGAEMVWDVAAPSIDKPTNPNGVSTFNDGFQLSVSAEDDASGVQKLEYYFDPDTEQGEGTSVDIEGGLMVEKKFTVSPDLGRGNHTVFVRAIDGMGKSDFSSFDFEYYPNREPKINLNATNTVRVTSGSSKSFTVDIANDSPFFVNGFEVTGSSAVWNGSKTVASLEEGESTEKTITVDASKLDVGKYSLTLKTGYGSSTTVKVIVQATESQKQSISSEVQNWVEKMNSLEKNISEISTLDKSNENVTQFTEKVSKAQKAVENGKYYRAKSYLENIESSFNQASTTYSESLEKYRKKKRNQLFLIAFFLVVLIGGGGIGGYLYFNGKDELPDFIPDDWDIDVPDEIPELGVVEKLKELANNAEEEVEEETGYSFEGFD